MARLGRGAWRIEDDHALVTIVIAGMPGYTVDLIADRDSGGPPLLLSDVGYSGGIAEATIRGPEDQGDPKHPGVYPWRPTLVLSWRNDPSIATASDAGLLVSDHGMQRAARRVLARIGAGGRTSRHEERVAAMVETARQLRAEGREPTRENVAKSLGKMSALDELPGQYKKDVQKAGGWTAILARAE